MSDKEYNGWTNYETWLVNLWVDNDQGSYNHARELAAEAQEAVSAFDFVTKEQAVRIRLTDLYKDMVEEMVYGEEPPASLATDLLGGALSEVDWREIAEHLLDEVEGVHQIDE